MVMDSFGTVVLHVVTNGLSPGFSVPEILTSGFPGMSGCVEGAVSRGASDSNTNPRCSSATVDPAKTHAGNPDGDAMSTRPSPQVISFNGTPSRACWRGVGTCSAWASNPAADSADIVTAITSIATFLIRLLE